jgi:hypothetical protein
VASRKNLGLIVARSVASSRPTKVRRWRFAADRASSEDVDVADVGSAAGVEEADVEIARLLAALADVRRDRGQARAEGPAGEEPFRFFCPCRHQHLAISAVLEDKGRGVFASLGIVDRIDASFHVHGDAQWTLGFEA